MCGRLGGLSALGGDPWFGGQMVLSGSYGLDVIGYSSTCFPGLGINTCGLGYGYGYGYGALAGMWIGGQYPDEQVGQPAAIPGPSGSSCGPRPPSPPQPPPLELSGGGCGGGDAELQQEQQAEDDGTQAPMDLSMKSHPMITADTNTHGEEDDSPIDVVGEWNPESNNRENAGGVATTEAQSTQQSGSASQAPSSPQQPGGADEVDRGIGMGEPASVGTVFSGESQVPGPIGRVFCTGSTVPPPRGLLSCPADSIDDMVDRIRQALERMSDRNPQKHLGCIVFYIKP